MPRNLLVVAVLAGALFGAESALAGQPSAAAKAYHEGRVAFYALKSDPELQKFRHHWTRAIKAFDAVVTRFPKSPEAVKALYTAAGLYADLYEISRRPSDIDDALARFLRVRELYPASTLADDALLEAADIHAYRGRRKDAVELLRTVTAEYAKGDRIAVAKTKLASLGGAEAPRGAKAHVKVPKAQHIVVIDAGHGGKDHGATGHRGLKEKDVNLGIAKKVADRLKKVGIKVALTRDEDEYISLDERAQLANEKQASVFVSIHANAAESRAARGVETYFLDVTHNRYSKRLAHRENAGGAKKKGELNLILADMATKVSTGESAELAELVQSQLVRKVKRVNSTVRDLGVKSAMLHVLINTRAPAILVETGFVSNEREEILLRRNDYQDAVADAIASGVIAHLDSGQVASR